MGDKIICLVLGFIAGFLTCILIWVSWGNPSADKRAIEKHCATYQQEELIYTDQTVDYIVHGGK